MARIYVNGFELNSAAAGMEVTAVGGSPTVQSTTVRSGSRAAQITGLASGTAKGFRENFAASTQVGPYWFRTYFRYATAPTANNTIIQVNDTNAFTTQLASIELTSTGTLQLRDEDGTIGSPSSAMSANTWYMIEFKVNNTGGAGAHLLEARLNGSVFATASNRSLSANFITFNWGGNLNAEAQTTGNWFFDDIAINDGTGSFQNDYPGEGELIIRRPNGDSGTPQWAGSDGNSVDNYLLLDETPPNDGTDYVQSNTLDQIDLYTLDATPAAMDTTDVINCVMPGVRVGVDNNTGSDPDITIGLSVSGNVDESAAIDVSNLAYFTNHPGGVINNYPALGNNSNYEVPGTNTAWTKADLDSALFRLRQAASDTHFARVTAVWVYVDHKPASGTLFTQSVSGGITPSGDILKQGNKPLSGGNTPAGAVNKSTSKTFSGGITPSGNLLKQAQKALSGALSSIVGTLTTSRVFLSVLTGSITPSGTVTKQGQKTLAGSITPSGAVAKLMTRLLAGSVTPSGTLSKGGNKILGSTVTPTGALSKSTRKTLAGTVTSAGSLIKSFLKTLTGSVTPSGAVNKRTAKSYEGVLGPTGQVNNQTSKSLGGSITPTGSLLKRTLKFLTGTLTSAGELFTDLVGGANNYFQDLAGSITPTGQLLKSTTKSFLGSLTPSGSLLKVTSKFFSGVVTSTGTVLKSIAKTLSGAVTSIVGSISKTAGKSLSGNVTPTGSVTASSIFIKMLEGSVAFVGTLSKSVSKNLTGNIVPLGTLNKLISKFFSGAVSFIGSLTTISGVVQLATKVYLLGSKVTTVVLGGARNRIATLRGRKNSKVDLDGSREDIN